jgi:hypothetical protein
MVNATARVADRIDEPGLATRTHKSWENKEAGPEIAEGQQGAIRGMHWARTGPPNQAPSSLRDAEDKSAGHVRKAAYDCGAG